MKGIVFIPDISGFTQFVSSINIDLGVNITRDLLNRIIENNSLGMELSEIEGDAILFYKIGKPIPLPRLINGFNSMYAAFDQSFHHYKVKYQLEANLSLKLIVHYGNIAVYDIRGFKKLYGETVIESHTLLKNGNGENNYVLVTDAYMNALNRPVSTTAFKYAGYVPFRSQLTTDVKRIAYYFFSRVKKSTSISNLPLITGSTITQRAEGTGR